MSKSDVPVLVTEKGGVAIISLNRPRHLNALDLEMREMLADSVESLAVKDSVKAIVLRGEGRGFCSGGDVTTMAGLSPFAVRSRLRKVHDWYLRFLTLEKPVITAVHGPVVGAGIGLALLGDVVLAADDVRFQAGFPKLGALPDMATMRLLPRHIGLLRAKDLLLSNRVVEAAEAHSMGLVTRVVDPQRLSEEAMSEAERLSAYGMAFGFAKSILNMTFETSSDQFFSLEAFGQALALSSDETQRRIREFRQGS